MKTRNEITFGKTSGILLAALLLLADAQLTLHAQLVADGGTTNLTTAIALGGDLTVGNTGGNTTLNIIGPGGAVTNASGWVGSSASSIGNTVSVRNSGGTWHNNLDLYIGQNGGANRLVVSNGAVVVNGYGYIGLFVNSTNNLAVITGADSLWTNSNDLTVGYVGSGNQLVVTNSAKVTAANLLVGSFDGSANNRVTVDGGTIHASGAFDVRRGTNVFNAGLIEANNLVLNNAAGRFEFNGGTLITTSGTINNGQDFAVGLNFVPANATWVVLSNASPTTIAGSLDVGVGTPSAALLITNGGTLQCSSSLVGQFGAEDARVVISGPNSRWNVNGLLDVGYGSGGAAPSHFYITNGGTLFTISCDLAHNPDHYTLISGQNALWTNSGTMNVGVGSGSAADAIVTIASGGTLANGGSVDIGGGNSLITLSGGALFAGDTLNVRYGTLQLDSGTATVGTLLVTNGANSSILFNGGTLSVGSCTVSNGSPLVVGNGSSAATYQLTGNGLHTFNNGLVITNNAQLAGYGGTAATLSGTVTIRAGGKLDLSYPTADTLFLSNSPVLQGQVILQCHKDGSVESDVIHVTQPLAYGGSLTVYSTGGLPMTVGDTLNLFSASGYSGAFTSLTLPELDPGLMWTNQLLINGSIAVVPQVRPNISGLTKSGTYLVFNVTGGSPGGTYKLLTSTNVALPLSNWTTNSTGNFDWLGNLTLTNAIDPATPQRFFTIRAP